MFSSTFLNEGQKLYDYIYVFALDNTSVIVHSHMEGISVLA